MGRHNRIVGMTSAFALLLVAGLSQGETLADFFAKSHINGQIRSYYFSRLYGSPSRVNAYAYTLAGRLNVRTARFLDGFHLGLSFYTANSLGTQPVNPARLDPTLMGRTSSLNALGQAYLEYANRWLKVTVGDQLVSTPWLNRVGGRVQPVTYQGIVAQVQPMAHLQLLGLRIFRWENRTNNTFQRNNLYYPGVIAGPNVLPETAPASNGALAFGARYAVSRLKSQIWFYQFDGFANMLYWQGGYVWRWHRQWSPFINAQYTREWGAGQVFEATGTTLFGQNGQGVNSTDWGLKLGLRFPQGSLWWGYDTTLLHPGALGGGAIVSPYTVGYTADPLYVDAMIQGLVGVGPGHGWRVRAAYWFFSHQLQLTAGFSRFITYFSGNSNWTHFNVSYFPKGAFQGLCLRDQVEVGNGAGTRVPNPLFPGFGTHSFVYNRVMFTYRF